MRGYSGIALVGCKNSDNFGTACRSAMAFDVALVQMVRCRFRKQNTDTPKTWRHIPVLQTSDLEVPYDCVPVAVELVEGATPLPEFKHPERALYVFGPEDGSIPSDVLARCARKVIVPGRLCLNLAQAVTCVLYDRAAKLGAPVPEPCMGRKRGVEKLRL